MRLSFLLDRERALPYDILWRPEKRQESRQDMEPGSVNHLPDNRANVEGPTLPISTYVYSIHTGV